MSSLRRPPLHHDRRTGGVCKWCDHPILHEAGPAAGQANRRRAWHPDCVHDYKLHAWPEVQFAHVRKRDGAKCFQCGSRPRKWLARSRPSVDRATGARYVRVKRVCALELDHAVPLWSVAHLPADLRRRFYGPGNLRLLCPACHRSKTLREAADRAALKRAA